MTIIDAHNLIPTVPSTRSGIKALHMPHPWGLLVGARDPARELNMVMSCPLPSAVDAIEDTTCGGDKTYRILLYMGAVHDIKLEHMGNTHRIKRLWLPVCVRAKRYPPVVRPWYPLEGSPEHRMVRRTLRTHPATGQIMIQHTK